MTIKGFLESQGIKVRNGQSIADAFEEALELYCKAVGTNMTDRMVNSYRNTISLFLLTDDGELPEIEIVMTNINYDYNEVMVQVGGVTTLVKLNWK